MDRVHLANREKILLKLTTENNVQQYLIKQTENA